MSNSGFIELVSAAGHGVAFGPAAASGPGEPLKQASVKDWIDWLQQNFAARFVEQSAHWEAVLAQVSQWRPAQTPHMTFSRVARLLDSGQLLAWQLPLPEIPPQSMGAAGQSAQASRSQSISPAAAAPSPDTGPRPRGAASTPVGTDIESMQLQGDPVSPVSGEEILLLDDFRVTAALPLNWQRCYRSGRCDQNLGLGAGWYCELLRSAWQTEDATWILDREARPVRFPRVAPGEIAWQSATGQRLEQKRDGRLLLTEASGTVWLMQPVDSASGHPRWRPAQVYDLLGHQWRFGYDEKERLARLELSPSLFLQFEHDQQGQLAQVSLVEDQWRRVLASYVYDGSGNLTTATTARGTEHYRYQDHLLAERQLATGYRFFLDWQGQGPSARCLRTSGEDGSWDYRFDYQPDRMATRVVDGFGAEQVFHYDSEGRIVARQDPDGGVHHWQYNRRGRLSDYRLPDGRVTHYGYDPHGRLVLERFPDGREHWREYNPLGFCSAETLPDGRQIQRRFDALGRILQERRADGSRWHYHYGPDGWLSEACADHGETHRTGFDRQGQLLASEVSGCLNRYVFDPQGRVRGHLLNGLVTELEYQAGQASAVHQYPEQAPGQRQSRRYEYDDANRLTRFTSATGARHDFQYEGLARPVYYRRPDGKLVHYDYDQAQRLTRVVRPDGGRWTLSYNLNGQVSACQAPDGRHIQFRYDAAGDIIERTQPGEWRQRLKRDAGGRVLQQSSQGRERDPVIRQFGYDAAGRRTSATCSDRQLFWHYDSQGQPSSHQQGHHLVRYDYGPARRLESLELPDGTRVRYHYDRQGRWASVVVNDQTLLQRHCDDQGREALREGGSNRQSQVWDRQDRLVNRRWQGGQATIRRYTWDAESRLEEFEDSREGHCRFQRDPQGQLIAENGGLFAYDDGGNRQPSEGQIQQDRLLESDGSKRRYDQLGAEIEVRGDGLQRRRFDAEGQLIEVTGEGLYLQYGYDALGRRAWRRSAEGIVEYVWHGDRLLGEQRGGHWQWYLPDPLTNEPLLILIGGRAHYPELDWRGAPVRLWNEDGELAWEGKVDAWGACRSRHQALHQPLRLPGQFEDELTGLHFNRFRDYDPGTGRYLTPDPLGIRGGLNSYRYTPNPVDYIDPLGLDFAPVVTASNADQGELAPVPEDLPALQELPEGDGPANPWLKGAALVASVAGATYGLPLLLGVGLGAMTLYGTRHFAAPTPTEIPDSVRNAARASDLAYREDSRDNHFEGFREIGFDENGMDEAGLGLPRELFEDPESGFYAKLFKSTTSDEYMIAYQGTQMTSLEDWGNNFKQGTGMESEQYTQAMKLSQMAQEKIEVSGGDLSFTGHSLGGGLASAAAAVTDLKATTFNAAGLSEETVRRYTQVSEMPDMHKLVDAYYVKGDVLSFIQDLLPLTEAAGRRIALNPAKPADPLALHKMTHVHKALAI